MSEPYQIWSRTTFGIIFGVIIIGLVGTYITWQARFLLLGPQIHINESTVTVSGDRIVTIAGTTANITYLSLNGRPIFTDQYGYFQEEMILENGYTIATVAARDRFGRTKEVVREFMFLPASSISSIGEALIN
jgi:hypothetical protein